MKILLIAGHGGSDSGACAFGRRESELARELVGLIEKALSAYQCDVSVYPLARSAYHDLIAEGYSYNFKPYDYVLEVHFNACQVDSGNGKVKGSEIYVTREEKITSAEAAILERLSELGFTNRGIKRKNFSVIAEAKRQGVSSALLEVCFMDDYDDMKLYDAKKAAAACAEGIAAGYKLQMREVDSMAKFKDTGGHWAESAIDALSDMGIINGYADGSFKPDKNITRAETATMLARLLEKVNTND